MVLNFFSHGRKLDGAKKILSGSSTLSLSHNSPTTQGLLVFVVVFLRCLKHVVSFVVNSVGFCFSKTPYDSISQNFKTVFLGSNSLENAFMLWYY